MKKIYYRSGLHLRSLLWRVGILTLVLSCSVMAFGQSSEAEQRPLEKLKDEKLVEMLASNPEDRAEVYEAVVEIMRRGERLIPLLMRHKGNKQFFRGYGLGRPYVIRSAPRPDSTPEKNDGSLITVEMAALYSISAIYHDRLQFADNAYLVDEKPVEWSAYNTPERIDKAWRATELWVSKLEVEGMETLRVTKFSPLTNSGLKFEGDISIKLDQPEIDLGATPK